MNIGIKSQIYDEKMIKTPHGGLTTREAAESRQRYGANTIARGSKKSLLSKYLAGFSDPIIKILLGALAANIIFSIGHIDWYETAGIICAVMVSTVVTAVSEYGSERAFDVLRDAESKTVCRVRRDGNITPLPASEIVVGDTVILGAGDGIPADGVITRGSIGTDQSALNGESRERKKAPRANNASYERDEKLSPDDGDSLLRGCTVLSGNGEMEVLRVGAGTIYGGIAASLSAEKRDSPLKLRLAELAGSVSFLGYVAAGLVFIAYLFNVFLIQNDMNLSFAYSDITNLRYVMAELTSAITMAISVIVVAVPEGLPMMITVVLSRNMKRMLSDRVLVKKLVGIETAGSLNILFCDKTGTLTRGDFTVSKIITESGEYSTARRMCGHDSAYGEYARACIYNTDCSVSAAGGRKSAAGGNATDRVLLNSVLSAPPVREDDRGIRVTAKISFDSAIKFSAVSLMTQSGMKTYIKGAPELILPLCRFNGDGARGSAYERISERCRSLSRSGMRVIAVATAQEGLKSTAPAISSLPDGMSFICLVVISDEPRPEARAAVQQITGAGIFIVMITGDGGETARAVAQSLGIIRPEHDVILDGAELAYMSEAELCDIIPRLAVVSRALPSDKERLIRAAQASGLVAGMTGDGVNDAPALRAADVGFALGTGTEVAKEAGDIVILDNNIKSIGRAVLYGRTIFDSIRKFIVFQLTMNLCAVGLSLLCPFIGIEEPVTVIQMLWVNLIMDTLGGLAFAGEAPLPEYMTEPPKRRDEKILGRHEISRVMRTGIFAIALCILFLKLPVFHDAFGFDTDYTRFMTVFFAMFIFSGVACCFCCRTERLYLFSFLRKNKSFIVIMTATCAVQLIIVYFGGEVFRTVPLTPAELACAAGLGASVTVFDFIMKLISTVKKRRDNLKNAA